MCVCVSAVRHCIYCYLNNKFYHEEFLIVHKKIVIDNGMLSSCCFPMLMAVFIVSAFSDQGCPSFRGYTMGCYLWVKLIASV